jgi:hypothetical protein
LIALSAVLPAFVNFGVGLYITETMMLKANTFVYTEVHEQMRERKIRQKAAEKAKEMREKRQAAQASSQQPAK